MSDVYFVGCGPGDPELITVKAKKGEKSSGNIFDKALEGIRFVKANGDLKSWIFLSFIFGAIFISFKWLYNPLFEYVSLELSIWGFLIALFTVITAFGARLYKKVDLERYFPTH